MAPKRNQRALLARALSGAAGAQPAPAVPQEYKRAQELFNQVGPPMQLGRPGGRQARVSSSTMQSCPLGTASPHLRVPEMHWVTQMLDQLPVAAAAGVQADGGGAAAAAATAAAAAARTRSTLPAPPLLRPAPVQEGQEADQGAGGGGDPVWLRAQLCAVHRARQDAHDARGGAGAGCGL